MNNLKKYQRFACTAVLLIVAVAVCLLAGAIWSRWENHIYLPTYFTKIDDQYFIVDAGHYRVLYSDDVKSRSSAGRRWTPIFTTHIRWQGMMVRWWQTIR